MHVRSVSTPTELQRYLDFGAEVYRDNPFWVPPDPQHLSKLLSGQAGFGSSSHIQPFWVEEGDRVLATIAAVNDEAYNRHWQENVGHLLFFEALADQDAAVDPLLQTAGEWLKQRGCTAARLSLLPGMQLPLTIDAYDAVPTCFHTLNPPYYHSYIKNAGFITEKGVVQYQIRFTPELAQRYGEFVKRATDGGVFLRSWNFEDLQSETETFATLYNETFDAHWGVMPLPLDVMRGLTFELKDLLVPDFTAFAELDGQVVGFVYSLPDLNQVLHPMRGKAIPEHFGEFQQRFGSIDHGVLLIIGVRRAFRGRGINLALAARSYLAMIERGYKMASYTVVLDDNWPSRRTAEKLGGRVTRNFVVYRKGLQ